ncbi:Calcium-independent phospholipase A2-gamma [Daldinia childiae]|uniref:Calcium-independent phospholipase A2-gamma n=1 Tax=Daldinia childiae TaxID=326645 RepID=UPI0014460E13|nr:Calcium-independent phospholipase A2-gamma [Daldinia childiae]KAF3067100.1 Calcium-independent phospholipase A2-gamma [Daldinia childiae]
MLIMEPRFVCTFIKNLLAPVLIKSYQTPDAVDAQALAGCAIWQAARATSAAATFFDTIRIGNQTFVDGAFGCNNPIYEVFDEAKSIWPDAITNARVQCIVSIGTGLLDLKNFGDNAVQLVETLQHISTETEKTHKRFLEHHEHLGVGSRYFRFNVTQGMSDIKLGESERLDVIEAAAELYLNERLVKDSVKMFVSSRAPMNRT